MDKNQLKNILKEITELKSTVEIVDDILSVDIEKYSRPFQSFGNLIISGRNNIIAFNNLVDKIWTVNQCIFDNFSRKRINKEIVDLLYSNETINNEQINSLVTKLIKTESKDYWIYKEISGAILSNDYPIVLGPYKILNLDKHNNEIIDNSEYIQSEWDKIWKHCKGNILIGIKVNVKELIRGYEIAELKFKQFENIIKFLIPDFNKNLELTIVNRIDYELNTSYSICNDFYGISSNRIKTRTENIDLSNPNLYNEEIGTQQLFEIISKTTHSEVEKRILTAIDWIGKGLSEIEYSKAFIQIMFAIEALLNFRDKEIIQPSILSRISEFIAFTIGSNYNERIKLENDFKHLYGLRSSIAHGNDTFVNRGDFILLLSMARDLVWEFLKNKELRKTSKFDDYIVWIKQKKYHKN